MLGFFKKAALAIGGVFAAGKIIDFGKSVVQAAADADAIRSQYTQVFGSLSGDADKMAKTMGAKFGMIPEQLQPGMIKFQSMFKGVGIDAATSMKMTESATTAAADAAAFANISYEDAQGSLQSFILGNYEAGDAIGIQANDNAVAQYAIQQGAAKTTADWQKMGDAQKEQMRLGFIEHFQKMSGVQGQAARESGSYAVQLDKLKAIIAKVLALIGGPILEPVVSVMQRISKLLQGHEKDIQAVAGIIGKGLSAAVDIGASAFEGLAEVIGTIYDAIKPFLPQIKEVVKQFFGFQGIVPTALKSLGGTAITAGVAAFKALAKIIKTVVSVMKPLMPVVVGIAAGFATYGAIVGTIALVATTVAKVTAAFKAVKGAIETVRIAMMLLMDTNPIILVITAVAALVAGLVYFFTQTTKGKEMWSNFINWLKGAWDGMKTFFSNLWQGIQQVFQTAVDLIKTIVSTVWNGIKLFFQLEVAGWKLIFTTAWAVISTIFTTTLNVIKTIVTTVFNGIKLFITTIWNAIKITITTVWNGIQTVITTVVNAIKAVITSVWNAIKSVTSSVFNSIKSVASSVWNGIKSVVTSVVNGVKSAVTNAWNSIKSVTSSVFNGIKSVASSVWNSIKSTISNVVNGIKSTVSNVWNGIKSVTSSVWNGIKSAITGPIQAARDTVSNIVERIKSIFNGIKLKFPSISIPHIPLPHFSISGSFNPLKGKIPSIGIDWFAKGGILNDPTIFGMAGGNMLGGGEAGPEAVLPLNKDTLSGIGAGISATMNSNGIIEQLTQQNQLTQQQNKMFSELLIAVTEGVPAYVDLNAMAKKMWPMLEDEQDLSNSLYQRGRGLR